MDQSSRFLGILSSPYKQVCCGCSLKTGVNMIAIWDTFVGINATIDLLLTFFGMNESASFLSICLSVLFNIFLVVKAVFAVLAIKSLAKQSFRWINRYYIVTLVAVPLFISFSLLSIIWLSKAALIITVTVLWGLARLAFASVIWSAQERISNNQISLVMHGASGNKKTQEMELRSGF